MESKVDFVAVDFSSANRLTVHIRAAVAEHEEAVTISQRTQAALAAAEARGVVLDGNRGNLPTVAKSGAAASILARQRNRDLLPVIRHLQAAGAASLSSIAAKLDKRGIESPRGGCWHPNSVRRILQHPN